MDFNGRQRRSAKRVKQRHAGMGESAGVDQQTVDFFGGGLPDAVDQSALDVGLEKVQLYAKPVGFAFQFGRYVFPGLFAINGYFTPAQRL